VRPLRRLRLFCLVRGPGERSRGVAGGDGLLFAGEDGEEAEDAHHLEAPGDEGRGIDQPSVSADLAGAAQGSDDGADARGVDVGGLLEVEEEVETAAGDRLIQSGIEFGCVGGLELAFDAKDADGTGLADVEIQRELLEELRVGGQNGQRMEGLPDGGSHPAKRLVHSPSKEIRACDLYPSSVRGGAWFC